MRWDSLLSHPGSCPADRVHLKADQATRTGAIGALLRRHGLYSLKQRAKLSRFWSAPLRVDRIRLAF
jgi:hypothetical protein